MNTQKLIEPLENKKRQLLNEKTIFLKNIGDEINSVETSIKEAVKELTGISDNCRTWIIGDVFITRFWGVCEVCIIKSIDNGHISFIRLESIRDLKTFKKDYCAAEMEVDMFLKIWKIFLHHSEWYSEYTD